ncbi:hypothetical protein [Parasphaerochaeta coccoides]|nr:hypothetical protein [Parasphaerochaeta coccoides]
MVALLVSCGMPRPLFVESSTLVPQASTGEVRLPYTGNATIVLSSDIIISPTESRNGIMLFYTITDDVTTVTSSMQNIFTTETTLGSSGSSLGGRKPFTLDIGNRYGNSTGTQFLYPFTFVEVPGAAPDSFRNRSGYAVPFDASSLPTRLSSTFDIKIGEGGVFELSHNGNPPIELYNYSGRPFIEKPETDDVTENGYFDYLKYKIDDTSKQVVSEPLQSPTIHIYAVFFLNDRQGGNYYTNNYWSNLYRIAAFPLEDSL